MSRARQAPRVTVDHIPLCRLFHGVLQIPPFPGRPEKGEVPDERDLRGVEGSTAEIDLLIPL